MRKIFKYFNVAITGLTILLFFAFTLHIKKISMTYASVLRSDNNSTKIWDYVKYTIQSNHRIESKPSIVSENEIYFYSGKNIYLFNGYGVKVIYTGRENALENFATDGKYFIYSYPPTNPEQDELRLPSVFIGKVIRNKRNVVLRRIGEIDIPLSNAVQSINFIKPGVVAITTIMEYVILEFNEPIDKPDDLEITLNHYALQYGFSYTDLVLGSSSRKGIFTYNSVLSAYYLNSSESKPRIKLVFNIPQLFPDAKTIDDYPKISSTYWLDSNSVLVKTKNGVGIYERNKSNFSFLKTFTLSVNEKISATEIQTVSARNENEFWAVTNNNLLISVKKNGENWSNYKCDVILKLPVQKQYANIFFTDNDHPFLITDNFLLALSKKDNTEPANKELLDTTNYPYLLITHQYWNPGNTYGIAISDIDNDDNEEAYIVDILNKNKLFSNILPKAYTTDLADSRGLIGRIQDESSKNYEHYLNIGVTCGDIDEDGDEDFVLGYLDGSNSLLLNNGEGYFRDVTEEYGLDINLWRSECSVLGDVNNDGFLDLFSTSFIKSNRLFINNDGEQFEDITKESGLESNGTSVNACFGDVNGDGYLDLYVGNWVSENRMYLNNGDGTFQDISKISGTSYKGIIKKTNSVMFADFDNDGDLDLFVGNRGTGNNLFINKGNGIFTDNSADFNGNEKLFTYGTSFGDINNDGWLDILVNYIGGVKIYLNKGLDSSGSVRFEENSQNIIRNIEVMNKYNTAIVTFDKDNDGDVDILIGQYRGKDVLLTNNFNNVSNNTLNYLKVKVIGSKSNRSGIGAKLRLFNGSKLIAYREVSSGYGYASSGSKIQHFGIPDAKSEYRLEVEFPASKTIKSYKVKPGTLLVVNESSGINKSLNLIAKNYKRVLLGKNVQWFGLKLFIVVLILSLLIFISHLRTIHDKYIYIQYPAKTLLISILFYSIISLIISFTQKLFLGNQLWVSGKYNFFIEEIIPVILTLIFFSILNYYYQSGKVITLNLFIDLFPKLRKFGHGEGMAINLNRLNFYVQNLESVNKKPETDEVMERFTNVIQEFREVTYPELMEVSHKLRAIRDKGFFVKSIKHSANKVLFYINELKKYVNKVTPQKKNYLSERKRKLFKKKVNESVDIIRNEIKATLELLSLQFACNVNETVHMVVEKFRTSGIDNINIQFHPGASDTKVVFKPAELFEVLSIIIQNAIQAFEGISRKEKTISINIQNQERKTIIEIKDNGKGLNRKEFQKLFLPGFTTKKSGHGFGLYYVKLCIDKYGGKISCQSEEGIGSTFTIELVNVLVDKDKNHLLK